MTDVKILNRTEFSDLSRGSPGVPMVMITFQRLDDQRFASVAITKATWNPTTEKTAIKNAIDRMGSTPSETLTV